MATPAITQALVPLNSSTAVALDAATSFSGPVPIENATYYSWTHTTLFVQNVDPSATVYLGNANVTSSAYGIQLAPGASVSIEDLHPTQTVYAISTGSSNVAVLAQVE